MKKVVADTSSLILLFKAGLLDLMTRHYDLCIVPAVFDELIQPGYPGADTVEQYRQQERLRLVAVGGTTTDSTGSGGELPRMGIGERDTIRAFLQHEMHFVLIDDGTGAGYCRQAGIPYINALLVPRVLLMAGRISREDNDRFRHRILEKGRYSARIIDYAGSCDNNALAPFI